MELCDGYFKLLNFPCRKVELVAIVVGIQEWEKKITYTLDDGSDVIDCRVTKDDHLMSITMGDTVRCCGKVAFMLRRFGKAVTGPVNRDDPDVDHSRWIDAESLEICVDPTDEVRHWKLVSDLCETVYSQPFVLPELAPTSDPITPVRKRKREESSSPSSRSDTLAPLAPSPSTKGSPHRLRHPSRLRGSELTANLFQTYLNTFICAALERADGPPESECVATPSKSASSDFDATPRPKAAESKKRRLNGQLKPRAEFVSRQEPPGFTLSYLRRVPQLAELACRVVRAEAERRAPQQQNNKQSNGKPPRTSRHRTKEAGYWSETDDLKAKRLYMHALRNLIQEGTIVLGTGLPRSVDGLHLDADVHWCSQSRKPPSEFPSRSYPVTAEPPSPVRSDEESYVPLLPLVLRQHVLQAIQHRITKGAKGGVATEDILTDLRKDERWSRVGEWHILETLRSMDGDSVCKRGPERWSLIL